MPAAWRASLEPNQAESRKRSAPAPSPAPTKKFAASNHRFRQPNPPRSGGNSKKDTSKRATRYQHKSSRRHSSRYTKAP
ncbi:hypothetical protein M8J75_005001 [Diaphorina citri]|nr:hypothetical protein M8J75_005001 [Diaphorina citri]